MSCDTCKFHPRRCVCQPFWKSFDETVMAYTLAKDKGPHVLCPMKISTMTFSVRIPYVGIWFDSIRYQWQSSVFAKELSSKYKRLVKDSIKLSRTKVKKKKNGEAYNYNLKNNTLFLYSYLVSDKTVVKVTSQFFHNGSITMTGLKSIKQAVDYLHKLMAYLKSFRHDPCYYRPIREYINPSKVIIVPKKGKGETDITILEPQRVRIDSENDKIYGIEIKSNDTRWYYDVKSYRVEGGEHRVGRIARHQIHYRDARVSMLNMNFRLDVMIRQTEILKLLDGTMYSIWMPMSKSELRPVEQRGPINAVEFKRDGNSRSVKILYVPNYTEVTVGSRKNTRAKLYRFPREVTIIMHRSGSVMFNGAKNIDDIFHAYNFVLCMVRDNPQIILKRSVALRKSSSKSYELPRIVFETVLDELVRNARELEREQVRKRFAKVLAQLTM